LLFRIKAILRRQIRSDKIELGLYTIDCHAKQLYKDTELLHVTTKAIDLLLLLVVAKGEVVNIEQIESKLWHTNEEVSLGAIRVYIASLKKYFPSAIQNVRGIGYRLIQSEL
jgi:two-component system, OmpR family, response regulator QseB